MATKEAASYFRKIRWLKRRDAYKGIFMKSDQIITQTQIKDSVYLKIWQTEQEHVH